MRRIGPAGRVLVSQVLEVGEDGGQQPVLEPVSGCEAASGFAFIE